MDPKFRMQIGPPHSFEAEGDLDAVAPYFEAWKKMVGHGASAALPPPAPEPKPGVAPPPPEAPKAPAVADPRLAAMYTWNDKDGILSLAHLPPPGDDRDPLALLLVVYLY